MNFATSLSGVSHCSSTSTGITEEIVVEETREYLRPLRIFLRELARWFRLYSTTTNAIPISSPSLASSSNATVTSGISSGIGTVSNRDSNVQDPPSLIGGSSSNICNTVVAAATSIHQQHHQHYYLPYIDLAGLLLYEKSVSGLSPTAAAKSLINKLSGELSSQTTSGKISAASPGVTPRHLPTRELLMEVLYRYLIGLVQTICHLQILSASRVVNETSHPSGRKRSEHYHFIFYASFSKLLSLFQLLVLSIILSANSLISYFLELV
ncbi:unnamed protein product [Protopolystoma xenopodis]|uniref:Uncharacterized protein n=1 Tax=Protopolystoma xenopodis TaxID=117903 RepID=A0A448XNF3_9PLAT|nr:unnamed protein product [Protopolystoma xenopodis]